MPFYKILRMGCGVSKIDANGDATPSRSILSSFPPRKRHSTKSTPSKIKEPLLSMPENDDRPSTSSIKCDDNLDCVAIEVTKKEDDNEKRVARIRTMVEEAEKNDEQGRKHEGGREDDDDKNDDDQRAISKTRVHADEEDGDFPASPSFRVYFTDKNVETKKDNKVINEGSNKVGLKDVIPVATKELAESTTEKEEEKRETRKKSTFRNVLPRNLLNNRSSSNSPTRSSYHHKVAS